jgi:hypothetical protein
MHSTRDLFGKTVRRKKGVGQGRAKQGEAG